MTGAELILMADDDEDFVFLMRLAVQRAQIPVELIPVHNGVEIIDFLQGAHDLPGGPGNRVPSMVILDAHLRLLTGYQVLEWIRLQPKFANLPVVILTGSEVETQDVRARKLGADGYHDKPFTMDSLVDLVRDLYARFGRNRQPVGARAA
jgi:DNA-binding response OmpR family regulator